MLSTPSDNDNDVNASLRHNNRTSGSDKLEERGSGGNATSNADSVAQTIPIATSTSNNNTGLSSTPTTATSGERPSASSSSSSSVGNALFGQIYVSHISKGSLADLNGKLQVGDQILEINGIDVRSVSDANNLLLESTTECVLLVGRVNAYHNHTNCRQRIKLKRQQKQQQQHFYEWLSHESPTMNGDATNHNYHPLRSQHVSLVDLDPNYMKLLGSPIDMAHMKENSGELCPNDDISSMYAHIDHDFGKDEKDSGVVCKTDAESNCTRNGNSISDYEQHSLDKSGLQKQHQSEIEYETSGHIENRVQTDFHSDLSLNREMSLLNKEMENIQLQCDKLINHHADQQNVSDAITSNRHLQQKVTSDGSESPSKINRGSTHSDSIKNSFKPSPPPTPKHYPKTRHHQQQSNPQQANEKYQKTTTSINASRSKANGDTSPNDTESTEKKESIKQWIRNATPANRASSEHASKSPHKLVICKPSRIDTEKSEVNVERVLSNSKCDSGPYDHVGQHKDNHHVTTPSGDFVFMADQGTQMSDIASMVSYESGIRHNYERIDHYASSSRLTNGNGTTSAASTFNAHFWNASSGGGVGSREQQQHQLDERTYATVNNYIEQQHYFSPPCPTTMYTNKANLEHTIRLQQELLRQALLEQQQRKMKNDNFIALSNSASHQMCSFPNIVASAAQVVPSSPSKSVPGNVKTNSGGGVSNNRLSRIANIKSIAAAALAAAEHHQYDNVQERITLQQHERNDSKNRQHHSEWKVKKRPDGSRYIVRRPVRNKILRERAERINQERSGLTTDDDAMSELKVGRYWTRDERKKQLEQGKDRKRKELLMRSMKMDALREHSEERELCAAQKITINANGFANNSLHHQIQYHQQTTPHPSYPHHHQQQQQQQPHHSHHVVQHPNPTAAVKAHAKNVFVNGQPTTQLININSTTKNRQSDLLTVTTV